MATYDKDPPATSIEMVLVKPKNLRACHYWINESEDTHSKPYGTLHRFLSGLVPEQSRRIEELLNSFKTFLVVVPTKEIIELEEPREEVDAKARIGAQFAGFLKRPFKESLVDENKIPDMKFIFSARREILGNRQGKESVGQGAFLWGMKR